MPLRPWPTSADSPPRVRRPPCFWLLIALGLGPAGAAAPPAFAKFITDTGDPNLPKKPEPQPAPQPPQPGCAETLTSDQPHPGAATLNVQSPCRRSGWIEFDVAGHPFSAAFDATGRAQAVVPLFGASTHVTWTDAGGTPQAVDIAFDNFDDTVQVVLLWTDPVDLDLRIVEPRGPFPANAAGNVSADRPNTDGQSGYGVLVRPDDGTAPGTHAEIYVLAKNRNPIRNETLSRGELVQKIGYATRELVRTEEYCDKGALAAPVFVVYRTSYGKARPPDKKQLPAVSCASIMENSDRLFRADPPIDLRKKS